MTKRARLAPAAADDLDEARRHIDRNRPGWGDKLLDDVLDAIDHIERHPNAWQLLPGSVDERRFVLDRFPCVLVYYETVTELVIVAVVYGGREPGYWRGR